MSASHSIRANWWPAFARSCADRSASRVRPHLWSISSKDFQAEVDTRRVVASDGAEIPLTAAEFDLLLVFLQRPGRVLTRDYLLDQTQGKAAPSFDRSIDVLVSRLRHKLGEPRGDSAC